MNRWWWLGWLALTMALGGYYGFTLFQAENKQQLLIGEASHGHFQIELACSTCHTDAFGGQESIQEACVGCHAEELKDAHDSHPKKKFTDPRNADLLQVLSQKGIPLMSAGSVAMAAANTSGDEGISTP